MERDVGSAPGSVAVPPKWVLVGLWAIAIVVFATQWYAYDASRHGAEPFAYYLWWSGYMWALLTPAALWLAWRFPITRAQWRQSLPVHVAASIALTVAQLSLEAYLGWLRHAQSLTAAEAVRHYFSQHTQVSLATYWILVGGVLLYRARQDAQANRLRAVRLESQLTAARLQVLRSQLNPHFLFNTLQAVTALVREDPERAEEMLERLGELLRVTLRESQRQEIPLEEELAVLEHYTAIQMCRFEDRLRFAFDMDDEVRACLVPTLLLQPIVENAVRYGVGSHRGDDTITVRAVCERDDLRIEIRNGIGSLHPAKPVERGSGLGLRTTRERLSQLYGADRSSLRLVPHSPTGVTAEIRIPARRVESDRSMSEEMECPSESSLSTTSH